MPMQALGPTEKGCTTLLASFMKVEYVKGVSEAEGTTSAEDSGSHRSGIKVSGCTK